MLLYKAVYITKENILSKAMFGSKIISSRKVPEKSELELEVLKDIDTRNKKYSSDIVLYKFDNKSLPIEKFKEEILNIIRIYISKNLTYKIFIHSETDADEYRGIDSYNKEDPSTIRSDGFYSRGTCFHFKLPYFEFKKMVDSINGDFKCVIDDCCVEHYEWLDLESRPDNVSIKDVDEKE